MGRVAPGPWLGPDSSLERALIILQQNFFSPTRYYCSQKHMYRIDSCLVMSDASGKPTLYQGPCNRRVARINMPLIMESNMPLIMARNSDYECVRLFDQLGPAKNRQTILPKLKRKQTTEQSVGLFDNKRNTNRLDLLHYFLFATANICTK